MKKTPLSDQKVNKAVGIFISILSAIALLIIVLSISDLLEQPSPIPNRKSEAGKEDVVLNPIQTSEGESIEVSKVIQTSEENSVESSVEETIPNDSTPSFPIADVKASMFGDPLVEGKKYAFLTIDDGAFKDTTPLLLDELDKAGIKATFFLVGDSLHEGNEKIVKRIYRDNHAIGFHSNNHVYQELYPGRSANPEEILRQADVCMQKAKAILGKDFSSHLWRYPGGHMSWNNIEAADALLADYGLDWIDWNAENGDGRANNKKPTTVQASIDAVLEGWIAYGSPDTMVILMHDGPSHQLSRDFIVPFVQEIEDMGFEFAIMH